MVPASPPVVPPVTPPVPPVVLVEPPVEFDALLPVVPVLPPVVERAPVVPPVVDPVVVEPPVVGLSVESLEQAVASPAAKRPRTIAICFPVPNFKAHLRKF